jgi:hypothetical protein
MTQLKTPPVVSMSPKYDFSLIHIKPATGLHQALFSCGGPLETAPSLIFVNVRLPIAWQVAI